MRLLYGFGALVVVPLAAFLAGGAKYCDRGVIRRPFAVFAACSVLIATLFAAVARFYPTQSLNAAQEAKAGLEKTELVPGEPLISMSIIQTRPPQDYKRVRVTSQLVHLPGQFRPGRPLVSGQWRFPVGSRQKFASDRLNWTLMLWAHSYRS